MIGVMGDCLIKDLKACLLTLHSINSEKIQDQHPSILVLFGTIENILRRGLLDKQSFFGFIKRDYWNWIEKLPSLQSELRFSLSFQISNCIQEARKSHRVFSVLGRGRLFLRSLVQAQQLALFIKLLRDNPQLVLRFYDPTCCILLDDIKLEILHSLFADLGRLTFDLNLSNCDFLDDTWEIPTMMEYQLVPCRCLGLGVKVIRGYYVVAKINETSVVLDENILEPGDILSEFIGQPLRGAIIDLKRALLINGCRPINLKVVKLRADDGRLYKPIVELLEKANYGNLIAEARRRSILSGTNVSDWPPTEALDIGLRIPPGSQSSIEDSAVAVSNADVTEAQVCVKHRTRYVGQCYVGPEGGIRFIPDSIMRVIEANPDPKKYIPVCLSAGELELFTWGFHPKSGKIDTDGDPLIHHNYPQISAIGRRKDHPRYIGYIAGETTCTLAKKFLCYVYLCINETEASAMIALVSHGFDRTHWTT